MYIVRKNGDDIYLEHAGKKGSKWGYTHGKRNGKRTAGEGDEDLPEVVYIDGKMYSRDSKGKLYRTYVGKGGVEVKEYAKVKNSNSLFGKRSTTSSSAKPGVKTTTYERGQIDRLIDKGRKFINSIFG